MMHDNGISNSSKNRPFQDVLRTRISRRNVLAKGMMLSAAGFVTAVAGNKALVQAASAATGAAESSAAQAGGTAIAQRGGGPIISFEPVLTANGSGPEPTISSDYQFDTLIPWGTPIQPGGPSYDGTGDRPTSEEQLQQIGLGHDGMWFFPIGNGNDHGMMAINHEYGTNFHVFGGEERQPASLEEVRRSQHVHGVAVVEIKQVGGKWQVVASQNARRITPNTPVTFSGPAANSPLLQTPAGNPTLGTVNNCANGYTPWGTYLTCEENFNGYFGATGDWTPTDEQARYGFSPTGFGYGWYSFDPRFDLSNPQYKNEENRFGWVVEIDPMDGSQTPVKRTALGRCKHEGVALAVGRGGRAVAYMGDDERFDYIYKFVSESNWRSMRARGISPLDRGVLYVAKFNDDGTGDWVELSMNNPDVAAKFSSDAEVLTYARLAADAAGATPMDRPEWTTVAPDGTVYCALTNNTRREEANAANPLAPNPDGHIIRFLDGDNHVGTTFTWNIFVLAANTQGDGDETSFSSPDGLWADPDGRLFIETDGGQPKGLNDQMLVANTVTGEIRRMFTGVTGCEVTGVAVTPDRKTMFVNLQHPGDGDPANTNFPASFTGANGPVPRDATVVITRKDGGVIGS